jgi:hypothetical protein
LCGDNLYKILKGDYRGIAGEAEVDVRFRSLPLDGL